MLMSQSSGIPRHSDHSLDNTENISWSCPPVMANIVGVSWIFYEVGTAVCVE